MARRTIGLSLMLLAVGGAGIAAGVDGRLRHQVRRVLVHAENLLHGGALDVPAGGGASDSSSSSAFQFAVGTTRPRVWLDQARLDRLRRFAARNTSRWQRVKASADAALDATDAAAEALPLLGLAYQVTGRAVYCTRAATVLRTLAVPTNDLSGDHYYNYRFDLRDIVAGYDWCYSTLSTSDRQQVARWLMDRADQVWPETNPPRAEGWAIAAPGNNYYYGFLMTWPAALAAWGDDTGTHPVSGSNRPDYHIRLALGKWYGTVRPLLDGWGRGGAFAESTNYDSTLSLARLLDAHLTATGQNLAEEPGFDFVRDSILWRIHITTPSKAFYYPLGDQPRVSLAELSSYDRLRMLPVRGLVSDTTRRNFAQHWLNTITPRTSEWSFVHAWEFLDYDEDAPATDYASSMALSYFAPGPGVLLHRSSWADDATYFGIWAGPVRESHQSRDANGFKIWRGGWLAGDANIWSHSGILGETRFHNNVTLGGREQTWVEPTADDTADAATVVAVESTSAYQYFAGQAARAYGVDRDAGRLPYVTDYLRRLLYLPSEDTFLIYDRIATPDTSRALEWHLHSLRPVTVEGRTWHFDNGNAALHGQSLLPSTATTLGVTDIYEGTHGVHSNSRLDVVSRTGRSPEHLLNVLRLRPMAQVAPAALAAATDVGETMDGTVVGTWMVLIARADVAGPSTSWRRESPATTSLLAGLRPSSRYLLTARDAGGATRRTVEVVTSAAGIVRVDATAGDASYTLDFVSTVGAPSPPANLRLVP